MKIKIRILLLALFTAATLSSLFAEVDRCVIEEQSHLKNITYSLKAKPSKNPIFISLPVGSLLCVEGDRYTQLVGENEMTDAGHYQFDGTHFIKYEGGIGGKEGTKTIYNFSCWSFNEDDYNASIKNQSNHPLEIKVIHNIRGVWKFQGLNPTPENAPQEITFTNNEGRVATIEVTVNAAE